MVKRSRVFSQGSFLGALVSALLILGILFIVSACNNDNSAILTTNASTTAPDNWPTSSPYLRAPIDISTLSDGQTLRVNLVRFTDTIPSPDATVTVNNSPVTVDDDNYYVYLDLQEGENVIVVKTITGTEIETQNIHIFFEPPLVVRLFYPDFDPDVNYMENPLVTINGDVSNTSAEVLVNGIKQEVRPDGTFCAEVLSVKESDIARAIDTPGSESALYGNAAIAVATLGDEIDTYTLLWIIGDNGRPGHVPGYTLGDLPHIITHDQTVTLKAGESTNVDLGVRIAEGTPNEGTTITSPAIIDITRKDNLGEGGSSLPMLSELKIHVKPSSQHVYPKIEYYFPIIIETELDLTPGDYYYSIVFSGQGYVSGTGLTVSVQ